MENVGELPRGKGNRRWGWFDGGTWRNGRGDEAVVVACKAFLAVHQRCADQNDGAGDELPECRLREYEASASERCRALREIQSQQALSLDAVDAKYEVLCALRSWLNYEDPRLAEFAVQLVAEYRDLVSRNIIADPQAQGHSRAGSSVGSWLGLSRILGGPVHLRTAR